MSPNSVPHGAPRAASPGAPGGARGWTGRAALATVLVVLAALAVLLAGCDAGTPEVPPSIHPGTADGPREVNLIAKDYSFEPPVLGLVPGETILLHVVNGGLVIHEAVIGDMRVQDAWEVAEAATVGAPPGPTPVVSVPPDVAGLRVVVESGQRMDVKWTVPTDRAVAAALIVGCHIPGHWAKGMQIAVRITTPSTP